MVSSIHGNKLAVLGGNQGGHAADADHTTGTSSRVSIAPKRLDGALGFFWPRNFPFPDEETALVSQDGAGMTMLILRGLPGNYAGRDWPRGALDEPPAIEYARRRGYNGVVLDMPGSRHGAHSQQSLMALDKFRRDESITALYGFSAGGYCVMHILHALSAEERAPATGRRAWRAAGRSSIQGEMGVGVSVGSARAGRPHERSAGAAGEFALIVEYQAGQRSNAVRHPE
jgi:hypothetical protein